MLDEKICFCTLTNKECPYFKGPHSVSNKDDKCFRKSSYSCADYIEISGEHVSYAGHHLPLTECQYIEVKNREEVPPTKVDWLVADILKENILYGLNGRSGYRNALTEINRIEVNDEDFSSKAEIEFKMNVLIEITRTYRYEYTEHENDALKRLGIWFDGDKYVYFGCHLRHRSDGVSHYRQTSYDPVYCHTFNNIEWKAEELTYNDDGFVIIKKWVKALFGEPVNLSKNNSCSSYYLKHVIEDAMGTYVSNADCKKALDELGYRYKKFSNSPNWEFGISAKLSKEADIYRNLYKHEKVFDDYEW